MRENKKTVCCCLAGTLVAATANATSMRPQLPRSPGRAARGANNEDLDRHRNADCYNGRRLRCNPGVPEIDAFAGLAAMVLLVQSRRLSGSRRRK